METLAFGYLMALLLCLLSGAAVTALFSRTPRLAGWLSVAFVLVALLLAKGIGAHMYMGGGPVAGQLFEIPLLGSALVFHVDDLSLLLLVAILFVGLWAAVFSVEYVPHIKDGQPAVFYPLFLLFLLGMCLVVTVWDLLFFVLAWEFMSLPAYLLVAYEYRRPENLRAALKYFILTHIGNLGMFIGALIIFSRTSSFSFPDAQSMLAQLSQSHPWLTNLILALFVLAFATKAGLFPTGDWLPDAHPAAPSSVSAMLSGVMIKMGPYGVLRLFFWVLAARAVPENWLVAWGLVLATWGAVSILLGSSAALACNDSKRLLAYSSISQSGYIFLGIGVALAALRSAPLVGAVALVGSLFHIVADALHKSTLFLTAGSVLYKTGERDLNKLGGLERYMPGTALAALASGMSLAGLPLTAAFVSKWMLVQSTLAAGERHAVL
ncbi:MAG: hypothetical protein H5T86_12875, partial [Armatimonadetes bacterium]|nr:hypothetical protein [Armatimonadota bacterium]